MITNLQDYIENVGPRWYVGKALGSTKLGEDVIAISSSGPPSACPPLSGWRVKIPCDALDSGTLKEQNFNRDGVPACTHGEKDFQSTNNIEMMCLDGMVIFSYHLIIDKDDNILSRQ